MAGIKVTVDDKQVQQALNNLADLDVAEALGGIGETLLNNTRERLERGVDVDGNPFEPLSPVTLKRKKRNKDKILIQDGNLFRDLAWQLTNGGTGLEFGSDRKYAATMQFGANQGAFGRSKRNGPLPWGDIPARPFIGLTQQDEDEILDNIAHFIESQLK